MSPDGERFVVRLIRGDARLNGIWIELFTGEIDRQGRPSAPRSLARLFTAGLGSGGVEYLGSDLEASDTFNPIRWIADEQIAFLCSNEHGVTQVVRIALDTGRLEYLTNHPTPIGAFDVSSTGVVLYNASARKAAPDALERKRGFAIHQNTDAYAVFKGDFSGISALDHRMNTEWFVCDRPLRCEQLRINARNIDPYVLHRIDFAPDGNLALINSTPSEIRREWRAYTQKEMRDWVSEAEEGRRTASARGVQQLFLVDLKRKAVAPLWNAPTFAIATRAAWSPDGDELLLAPTFLPIDEDDENSLAGSAAVVVDLDSRSFERLPIELSPIQAASSLRWIKNDVIEVGQIRSGAFALSRFERQGAEWVAASAAEAESGESRSPYRLEFSQSPQRPPVLVAVDRFGATSVLLDPNPGFVEEVNLGRVEHVSGKLAGGEPWAGTLFYPVGYVPGKRYPLVIQSQYGGLAPDFSLYGYGEMGPARAAPYAAQIMTNRGMAVLQLDVEVGQNFDTPTEAELRRLGFEAAAEHLVQVGIADKSRVGISGFSRNGYYVEYTLTHSQFPFAAAIAADNFDPSYISRTLLGDVEAGTRVNGLPPFGDGLHQWLHQAPGFNVEKVRTPLRKVEQSFGAFGVLLRWETFSRLRYLRKPVELYVVPNHERGGHNTQNPAQILAVQESTVDWFDYWLNGYEDPAPEKAAQYERWRELRQLYEADLAPKGSGGLTRSAWDKNSADVSAR